MLVRLETVFQHHIPPGLIYAPGMTIAVTREQRGLRAGLDHEFLTRLKTAAARLRHAAADLSEKYSGTVARFGLGALKGGGAAAADP